MQLLHLVPAADWLHLKAFFLSLDQHFGAAAEPDLMALLGHSLPIVLLPSLV